MSMPISHYTMEKKKILNTSDILFLLCEGLGQVELKFPEYVNFRLFKTRRTLVISMKMYVLISGRLRYSCASKMQSSEACFEGWAVVLKYHLAHYIDRVELRWDSPAKGELQADEATHYQSFLYRALHFEKMFAWFNVAKRNQKAMTAFYANSVGLLNGRPKGGLKEPTHEWERAMGADPDILPLLEHKFKFSTIGQRLPIAIQKRKKAFFPNRMTPIDFWGVDKRDQFHLFKAASKEGEIGMITELLFCCEVMYDTFVSGWIKKGDVVRESDAERALYAMDAIKGINGYFLFDDLPLLLKGVSDLLNDNQYGIGFFAIRYRPRWEAKKALDLSRLEYKSGFQLQEEHQQALYRAEKLLLGTGYTLLDGRNNLHDRMPDAICYCQENRIYWHDAENASSLKPSTYMLSSQVQCFNYLFPLCAHKEAVLRLARLLDPSIDDVLPSLLPYYGESYIDFEFVYHNDRILHEGSKNPIRGGIWTSSDACIVARRGQQNLLILIEWKYAEGCFDFFHYGYALAHRYSQLIKQSEQLLDVPDYYCCKLFNQLMRQTLLGEGIAREGTVDDYLHVVVAPAANQELLQHRFLFTNDTLEASWKRCLKNPDKFKIVDSRQILQEVIAPLYPSTAEYLKKRYQRIV